MKSVAFRKTFVLIGLLGVVTFARAQEKPDAAKAPAGYEMLLQAGADARSSKALEAAVLPDATLYQKRLALGDKPVVEALQLLREWLNRPQSQEPPGAFEGAPPEALGEIRQLGRALVIEQYVLLADGHVSQAIDTTRDCLRMSYAIRGANMLTWLTGTAVETQIMRNLARHFDQLSEKDCVRLTGLAKDWLSSPDPTAAMLENERKADLKQLAINAPSGDAGRPLIEKTTAVLNAMFAQYQADLLRPVAERAQAKPAALSDNAPEPDRWAAAYVKNRRQMLDNLLDSSGRQQAQARMLACHAAIRRYQWEHEQLPGGLTELNLGDLAMDPYTGRPFVYQVTKTGYTLESVGPLIRDDSGNPQPDQHAAISLLPTKK